MENDFLNGGQENFLKDEFVQVFGGYNCNSCI